MIQTDEILTTKEVMKYLKITRPTVFKLVKERKLKASLISGGYRFYKSDVDQFMKESSN